ncbi:STAS domain-containing protein [Roseobacter sp. HKCCA0434]|uniref:STAS domain-containing protein n=1 Tax=Roseobacter sp. HKCCA0434 TaxID=3079297 RepID=UPI002905EA6C|nr:STAS domain-containing protein [Roseobacter sp. HKCCA0434]
MADDSTSLELPPRADLAAAEALRDAVLSADPDRPVELDAGHVMQMSAPAAFVILSAARRAGGFVLLRPTECVTQAFSTLGLFAQMMKMEMR